MIRHLMAWKWLCVLSCLLASGCSASPDQRPTCEIHGLALLDDEVPVLYGFLAARACDSDPRTPHVNDYVWGGCRYYPGSPPQMAPIRYCPACRRAIAHRPVRMDGPMVHWVPQIPEPWRLPTPPDAPEDLPPDHPDAVLRKLGLK